MVLIEDRFFFFNGVKLCKVRKSEFWKKRHWTGFDISEKIESFCSSEQRGCRRSESVVTG